MTPCIRTTWSIDKTQGYGARWFQGRMWKAHRHAWFQARGPIPPGMCVLHRCDNRACINVTPLRPDGTPNPDDHLFLGTKADNSADMLSKGRSARGRALPWTRLHEDDVLTIRERLAQGESQRSIARAYSVSRSTIQWIALGKTWAWA